MPIRASLCLENHCVCVMTLCVWGSAPTLISPRKISNAKTPLWRGIWVRFQSCTSRISVCWAPMAPCHCITQNMPTRGFTSGMTPHSPSFWISFTIGLICCFTGYGPSHAPHILLLSPQNVQSHPFAQHLNSLVGHGASSSWGREALPTHFRASLAAHFTRRSKTQEGLANSLSALTGLPVQIFPFQAQWLQLPVQAGPQVLGRGAMLGSRVWCAQSKIKIDIGPMAYSAYQQLLPATEGRKAPCAGSPCLPGA